MKIFEKYKDKKIALYGLGTETERFITNFDSAYEIAGLLDGYKTDGKLFGKKIIKISDCKVLGVELIVVVARPASCKAITKKISEYCISNDIALVDIRGKNLLRDEKVSYQYENIKCLVKENAASDPIKYKLFSERFNEIMADHTKVGSDIATVYDAYDIGYLFCAPIITDFVLWMRRQIEEKNLGIPLLCARDGYLIKQLFDYLQHESVYFYTSRTAAIRAGVEDVDDLNYVDNMKFSGTLEQNLRVRFGIDEPCETEQREVCIADYADTILKRAQILRSGYHKYIESIGINQDKVALFDFVAKGTTQFFLGKIMNKNITGIYFLQLEPEFMHNKHLDIISFYTTEERENSAIYDNYYILETVLTSYEPSVEEIGVNGEVIFTEETRTMESISCAKRAAAGIVDYFIKYIEHIGDTNAQITKGYDETFLKLIHNFEIQDEGFMRLVIEDQFFNRNTDVKDII